MLLYVRDTGERVYVCDDCERIYRRVFILKYTPVNTYKYIVREKRVSTLVYLYYMVLAKKRYGNA